MAENDKQIMEHQSKLGIMPKAAMDDKDGWLWTIVDFRNSN